MDLREVCDFFGGTFLYDDYRGNLAAIHADLEQRRQRTSSKNIDEAAALLLLQGLWNLLSGDLKKSSEYLNSLANETEYGCRWAYRSHVYVALLRLWRKYPPILPMCDIEGPSMEIWTLNHWDQRPLPALSCAEKYFEVMSELEKLEFLLVKELSRTYEFTRSSARRLNTDFVEYTGDGSAVDVGSLDDALKRLAEVRDLASALSLPAISAYITRIMYWLNHLSGKQSAHVALETMRQAYDDANDDVGLGMYWLTRGDHNVSPPFTCPALLNFDIADSTDEFGGISTMFTAPRSYHLDLDKSSDNAKSSLETSSHHNYCSNEISSDKNLLDDPYLAHQCYDKAEMHFSKADAKRGCAIVTLRKACLLIMRGLLPVNHWSGTHKDREAHSLLADAQRLCGASGDYQLAKLIGIHQALLADRIVEFRSSLHAIGRSVEDASNEILGLQLALLSLRKGLYLRYFLGLQTESYGSLEVCRQVIKSMRNFKTLWYQVMLAEINHFKSSGMLSGSAIWIGHLKDFHTTLIAQCLHPIVNASKFEALRLQRAMRIFCHFSQATATAAVSIALQAVNMPEPLDASMKTILELLAFLRAEHLNAFRSRFELLFERRRAMLCEQRITQVEQTNEEKMLLQTFVENEDVVAKLDLTSIILLFDVLTRLQDLDNARKILKPIDDEDYIPVLGAWRSHFDLLLEYQRVIRSEQRMTQAKQWKDSDMLLHAFVKNLDAVTEKDLQSKFLLIDVLVRSEDFKSARKVLETIDDEDCIPVQYMLLARGTNSLRRRRSERLKQKSCELIFLSALRAKDWERASRLMQLLESISSGYFSSTVSYTKLWPWQRCLYAGVVLQHMGRHNDSMLYLTQALMFLHLFQDTLDDADLQRRLWVTPDATRLVNSIARGHLIWKLVQPNANNFVPTSDKQIETRIFRAFSLEVAYSERDHYNEALCYLEVGRSKYLWRSNTDQRRHSQLEDLYKLQLWEELKSRSQRTQKEAIEFRELEATIGDLESQVLSRATQWAQDRDTAKLIAFECEQLYRAIPEDAIVIYTGLSEDGLMIFAVDFTGIIVGRLNESATPKRLKPLILLYIDEISDIDSKTDSLRQVSRLLSSLVILEPIERCIAARNHVIFIPSGDLARIPFGALLFKDDFLAIQKQVSQVPSLTALCEIRSRGPTEGNTKTLNNVIARPGNPRDGWLPMAGIEAISVASLFGTTGSDASVLTKADLQSSLQESFLLHICTHGVRDVDHPLNSCIILKERFRVLDILAVRTKAALVVFSACLSGQGQPSDSGDVQGFAHAVLAAGARAFIGALWKVNDITTTLHMFLFYSSLLLMETPSFAEALHHATRDLYHLSVENACYILDGFLKACDGSEARGNPKSFTSSGIKKLQKIKEDWENGKNLLDFKHPRYWAPFVLVGDGSIRIDYSEREERLRRVASWRDREKKTHERR